MARPILPAILLLLVGGGTSADADVSSRYVQTMWMGTKEFGSRTRASRLLNTLPGVLSTASREVLAGAAYLVAFRDLPHRAANRS
jgi:hypothetical protein